MLRKRILLLIPLFSLIYFFFRGQKPYSFHHTKAVFEGKETAKEEFERIFATSLKDFDFFYQLDFTAQRLRLLPKLGEQEHRKAYEIMFPWLRKDNFEMQRAKGRFDGSGVVMVVNNINVRKAYTTIRNLDNSTEVQLFYLGAHELSPSHFKLLKSTQATLVNLFSEFPLLEKYSNTIDFAPFAILASTLEHIIYIEAGSILLTNPEQLSLEHEYQRYGVLFFKDANTKFSEKDNDYFHFAMAHMDAIFEPGYKIANPVVGRESVFYQNPSFLMIDKVRGYSGLRAVCSLMLTSAGQSKFLASEVFWVVFEAIGSEYGFYPNYPKALLDTSVDGYTDYDKVYFDSKGKLIWMSGDFVEKKLFKQDDGAIYLPSSIKLAEIRSLVRFDRIGTAVLPFNIYSLTTRQMKSIISVGTTTIEAYETYERSRSQPKQISPWSYKSLPCKPTTAKSAFSEWISERIDFWNSLDELFLRQKQHELYEFMRKLNSTTSSYSGMGIIYSCHPGIIKNTVISIQIVRKLGCNLPIELWYFIF